MPLIEKKRRRLVYFWRHQREEFLNFFKGEINFYAASLSFYTIFSLIPLLLIVFTLVTQLPTFQDQVLMFKGLIISHLMPTNTETVLEYLDAFMANSSGLGAMGSVYVLFASLLFFRNYQYIVTKMFNSAPRDFWNSVTVYWTLMTLLPIGLSVSIYFSTQAQLLIDKTGARVSVIEILPALLVWAMFFTLFKISSNKTLSFRATVVSSACTAVGWLLSKWGFVFYVFHNKTYLTLYGSFSILLFFLFWVYISWMILLYGMRLCELLHSGVLEHSLED